MRLVLTTFLIVLSGCLTGCGGGGADKVSDANQGGGRSGVLGRMHPKASAETVEELKAAEAQAREEQMRLAQQNQQASMNGMGRVLPPVSTDPISPPGMSASAEGPVANSYNPNIQTTSNPQPTNASSPTKIDSTTVTPAKDMGSIESPPAMEAATYSQHYVSSVPPPPPGAVAGGLVPPPPAVTLSTNANMAYGAPDNPYANPYMNPYAVPYPQYQQFQQVPPPMMQPPPIQQEPQRPQGLFGSGKKRVVDESDDEDDSDSKPEKKEPEFVPIRPTGMEARSPYKQKDDLKILWSGALNTYQMQKLMERDKELNFILKKVDVGLPPDSTKGMFTVAPRRVASIFRPIASERKSIEAVRKVQFDLVQSYYRYLYAYNKYAIQTQTVQARKQEIEVASSRAEKQRAEADMARAQDAAQSATEDMRAAQEELAAVAGAQSARSIIGRISGITPSVQALAQAEKSAEPIEVDSKQTGNGGMFGGMGNFLWGGNKDKEPKAAPAEKVVKAPKEKSPKAKSDKKEKKNVEANEEDLAPSRSVAMKNTKRDSAAQAPPERATSNSPINFELKDIEITARKSILTVAIRNSGPESFKFTPEAISIAEGDKKIAEASMRAEFDSTSVKPNGEVQGKITIFGRPWNDRLSVFVSDGSNNIQLKRNHN